LNHGESARLFNRRKHFVVWNAKWLFRHFRAAITVSGRNQISTNPTNQYYTVEFKLIKVMSLHIITKFVDFFGTSIEPYPIFQMWWLRNRLRFTSFWVCGVSLLQRVVSVRINKKWLNINCGFLNNLSKAILGHPQIYHKWVV
jgi:hypothetical protein